MTELIDVIERLRGRDGYTMREIAIACGVERSTVYNWLRVGCCRDAERMVELLRALPSKPLYTEPPDTTTRIRELVEELMSRRWSMRALAAEIGVSHGTVSSWMTGRHEPSPDTSDDVADALGELLTRP